MEQNRRTVARNPHARPERDLLVDRALQTGKTAATVVVAVNNIETSEAIEMSIMVAEGQALALEQPAVSDAEPPVPYV